MLTGSIPQSIGKISELEQLFLYANDISGNIPSSIGNMSLLSILALDQNMLEGSIPASLGNNCTNLQMLALSLNRLTGAIPEQVVGLSSFTIGLFLQQNYLTGALPSQVGNLKNIWQLYISENKLSGEIPSTLGDCLVLEFLHLEGNLFQGTIPLSLEQLKEIHDLNLSHNSLSGEIPSFLGGLRLIESLDLSHNKFEGEVPNAGVFMNVNAFSIVGNDKVCGRIKASNLTACPTQRARRKLYLLKMIILVTSITLSTILLMGSVFAAFYLNKDSKEKSCVESPLGNQYPTLSYSEIQQASNGFSSANYIGKGRFGSVYKGCINSGEQIVAVKVFDLQLLGANTSFFTECEILRNIRHCNLVRIITSCSTLDFKGNDFKALVFEFKPNGTAESWLHPTLHEKEDLCSSVLPYLMSLNLIQRLNIAIDVASALDYLHHQCEATIIHCDLKPSNVLLDNELCAHVAAFSLARYLIATNGESTYTRSSSSTGVRGTVGYVALEYGLGGEVSTEGDVYSYGILVLEMFTGKRPTRTMFSDSFSLRNYTKMALRDGIMEIVNSLLILEEEMNLKGPTNTKLLEQKSVWHRSLELLF